MSYISVLIIPYISNKVSYSGFTKGLVEEVIGNNIERLNSHTETIDNAVANVTEMTNLISLDKNFTDAAGIKGPLNAGQRYRIGAESTYIYEGLDFYIENPFRPQGLKGFMFSEGDFPSAGSGVIAFYPGTGRIRMRNAGDGPPPGRPAGFLRSRARGRERRLRGLSRFGTRLWRVPVRRGKPRRAGAGLHRFCGLHVLCPSPAPPPFRARSGATSASAAPTPLRLLTPLSGESPASRGAYS